MDKIEKYLLKLDLKESKKIFNILDKIKRGNIRDLDIKKLKGQKYIFRVRIGEHRIIYKQINDKKTVLFIGHRNEKTYKSL